MPEGGTVTVEVSNATLDRRYAALHPDVTPGPYVLVAVDDTGTGMPPEVAAQAFDPFFTTKRDGKGTGLGLSMVYGFVRQSNGHIRIDSAIGQGTSVKLYLPRTMDPVLDLSTDSAGGQSGSERVLVVEDNDEVRRAVMALLSGWGYRVVAAENPDVAAAILEKDAGLRPAVHRRRHARVDVRHRAGGDGAAPAARHRRAADLGLRARADPGRGPA